MAKDNNGKKDLPTRFSEPIPGLEGFNPEDDLILPQLKLVQGLSKEATDGIAPMGSIVNSVTHDVVKAVKDKSATVEVIPVQYTRSRIFFPPRSDGAKMEISSRVKNPSDLQKEIESTGGFICRSDNAINGIGLFGQESPWNPNGLCKECPMSRWDKNIPPPCTFFRNILVIVRGYDYPVPLAVSFGRTSEPTGKQFVNLLLMKQSSPWNFAYKLSTKFMDSGDRKWYIWDVNPLGKAKDNEIELGQGFYDLIQKSSVKIHEDESESPVDGNEEEDFKETEPGF